LADWPLASDILEIELNILSNVPAPPPFLKGDKPKKEVEIKNYRIKKGIGKLFTFTPKQYVILCIIAIFFILVFYLISLNNKLSDEIKSVKVDNANISTQAANAQQQVEIQAEEVSKLEQSRKSAIDSTKQVLFRKQKNYRNTWWKYIQKSNPNYITSFWGGISNLTFNVSNLTEYPIDEIEIEVRYLLKNGLLFQTEIVKLTDVIPYSQRKVTAPTTTRGTSVIISFKKFKSQVFNFCYGYGMSNGNKYDPWLCQ